VYCLACGKHVRLEVQLISAIVTSAAMYGGELGACTRSGARQDSIQ